MFACLVVCGGTCVGVCRMFSCLTRMPTKNSDCYIYLSFFPFSFNLEDIANLYEQTVQTDSLKEVSTTKKEFFEMLFAKETQCMDLFRSCPDRTTNPLIYFWMSPLKRVPGG